MFDTVKTLRQVLEVEYDTNLDEYFEISDHIRFNYTDRDNLKTEFERLCERQKYIDLQLNKLWRKGN